MAASLAHLELALLFVMTLCLALIPGIPVPGRWAIAAGMLTAAQTAAVGAMGREPFEAQAGEDDRLVHSVAEGVALLAVPVLTAVLLCVVLWHLAHAYALARHRLDAAMHRPRAAAALRDRR